MTAGIGHNSGNLTPLEAMQLAIADLKELAAGTLTGIVIETPEQAAAVEALVDEAKELGRDSEAKRKLEKQPHLDEGAAVDALWKPLIADTDRIKVSGNAALTPWRQKLQAEADALAKFKIDEAERLAAAAREILQSTDATDLTAREEAEELFTEAKISERTAKKVTSKPKGTRTYWTATITDHGLLLSWLKKNEPDSLKKMLDEYAQRCKNAGVRELAGVEFVSEERAV